MRKFFVLLTILFSLILLVSCAEEEKTYKISFLQYDETLISEMMVKEGNPIYTPKDPIRLEDEQYVYTFKGWEDKTGNYQSVTDGMKATADGTFVAAYNQETKSYEVNLVFNLGKGNVFFDKNLTGLAKDSVVKFTVSALEGYKFSGIKVDDVLTTMALDSNNQFSLTVTKNVKVEVLFEDVEPVNPDPNPTNYDDLAVLSKGDNAFDDVTVNDINAIKVGSSKAGGTMKITVGAGTTKIKFYAVAWKGTNDCTISISGATVSEIRYGGSVVSNLTVLPNDAFSGAGKAFTLTGDLSAYLVELTLEDITQETTLVLNSEKRFVAWSASGTSGDPTPVKDKYDVNLVFDSLKGNVSADKALSNLDKNTKVTFTVEASNLYKFSGIKVDNALSNMTLDANKQFSLNIEKDTKVEVLFALEDTVLAVDELSNNEVGGKGNQYTDWDLELESGNYYVAHTAFGSGSDCIQIRSKNNDSAILLAESIGAVKRIDVSFLSSTNGERTINVYGYNEAIESVEDFYDEIDGLELIGTIAYKQGVTKVASLNISGNYQYVALKSADGAIYIEYIKLYFVEDEGTEVVEYDLNKALEALNNLDNYLLVHKNSGTGDFKDDENYTYLLTEFHDGMKVKVLETFKIYGETYNDTTYFYYDENGVFHFVYEDYVDEVSDELAYFDISEEDPNFELYFDSYTYYDEYDFSLFTADKLEKVGKNKYQVKKEYVNEIGKQFIGDRDDESVEEDSYGDSYNCILKETFTSIVLTLKNDKVSNITLKSDFLESYKYLDSSLSEYDEEYKGGLVYSFSFSAFGEVEVTLPDAEAFQGSYSIIDVFGLEDGTEVSLDVYVNGVNSLEKIIFVCDDVSSIALTYDNINEIPVVGSTIKLDATVKVEGNLVTLHATNVTVDNSEPYGMINYDVKRIDENNYHFAGETVNYQYVELKQKDVDNLNVVFADLTGHEYKLSFIVSEKNNVNKLLENVSVGDTIMLNNIAVMLDGNDFVLVLMDHTEIEMANGLVIKNDSCEVQLNTPIQEVLEKINMYIFADGKRQTIENSSIVFDTTDYDKEKIGTHIIDYSYQELTGHFYVRVLYGDNTDAFKEEDGKGIKYVSERYGCSYGLPSTGNVEILVIPISFTNVEYDRDYKDILEVAFNGTSLLTGWESLASYYEKASYGQLHLHANIMNVYATGDPYHEVAMQDGNKYYPNDYVDNYSNLDIKYLDKAIAYYDSAIDYSKYDKNNDGYIDCVYIVYLAPIGESDNSLDYWWAYTNSVYGSVSTEYDGKKLDTYLWLSYDFFSEEIEGVSLNVNAETIIHETGHALGLDDYYDTNYNNNGGLGGGVMMDYNVGDHDAYSKAILGWINPYVVVNKDIEIEINIFGESGDAIFIAKDYDGVYYNEYIVVDLYSPTGLNELQKGTNGLPSVLGVRIMHVDATLSTAMTDGVVWTATATNNSNAEHKLISIVEADGDDSISQGKLMTNSDLWQAGSKFENYSWFDGTNCNFTIEVKSIENGKATISIQFQH